MKDQHYESTKQYLMLNLDLRSVLDFGRYSRAELLRIRGISRFFVSRLEAELVREGLYLKGVCSRCGCTCRGVEKRMRKLLGARNG